MKMKTLIILLVTIGFIQVSYGHALWIQTKAQSNINQTHEVKIFYGEFESQEFDEVDKWYSDVKDFKLYLTLPNGERKELDTKADKNCFTANFSPDQEGVYTLHVDHPAKEMYEGRRFDFSSTAFVSVGEKSTNPTIASPFFIQTSSNAVNTGDSVEAFVLVDQKPAENIEVQIIRADGWIKTVKTDKQGKISFSPDWKGNYILEASQTVEKKDQWEGKPLNSIWRGSTTLIQVI